MLALYRAGRQAEALDVYQDTRRRFIDDLGIEPGPELKRLQAEILRHGAGLVSGDAPEGADDDGEIVKALLAGRVVPVIGLDGAGDLAAHLASAFEVPDDRPVDLARVSQYVATMQGTSRSTTSCTRDSKPPFGRAVSPFSRATPAAPARAWCAAPAHRDDELRPRARTRLRGGG